MCEQCSEVVAQTGHYLDKMIASYRKGMELHPDATSAEHCVALAKTIVASANIIGYDAAMPELSMGMALAVTRLLAAQDIYGMPAT